MGVFDHAEFDDHESLHHFYDESTGLKAIVAVHSTALGPAAGGTRRWNYNNDADALTDVLRLSRGMSYKNAVAGLKCIRSLCRFTWRQLRHRRRR
jgi:leucine dehydrogenase